jgi:hypothetical protein
MLSTLGNFFSEIIKILVMSMKSKLHNTNKLYNLLHNLAVGGLPPTERLYKSVGGPPRNHLSNKSIGGETTEPNI